MKKLVRLHHVCANINRRAAHTDTPWCAAAAAAGGGGGGGGGGDDSYQQTTTMNARRMTCGLIPNEPVETGSFAAIM